MEDDGFTRALTAIVAMRGAGNESTIQENWSDVEASRHRVRVRQWFGSTGALLAGFLGLYLVGLPVYLSGVVETTYDALLVGVGAALLAIMWWAGVELALKERPKRHRWVVAGLGVTLILAAVILVVLRLGRAEWWHLWALVVGLSFVASSAALAFNQISELIDPYGWQSPYEQAVMGLLRSMMGPADTSPKVVERPLFPWRHGSREEHISANLREPQEGVVNVPARNDLNLADFLQEATRRGLGRAAWLQKGHARYVLPATGDRVTRGLYDEMIRQMDRIGYVVMGGDGDATRFLSSAEAAYDDFCTKMETEWGDVLGGES